MAIQGNDGFLKIRKESTGRKCIEGVRLVNLTVTITPEQKEWALKNGGSEKIRELLSVAMMEKLS